MRDSWSHCRGWIVGLAVVLSLLATYPAAASSPDVKLTTGTNFISCDRLATTSTSIDALLSATPVVAVATLGPSPNSWTLQARAQSQQPRPPCTCAGALVAIARTGVSLAGRPASLQPCSRRLRHGFDLVSMPPCLPVTFTYETLARLAGATLIARIEPGRGHAGSPAAWIPGLSDATMRIPPDSTLLLSSAGTWSLTWPELGSRLEARIVMPAEAVAGSSVILQGSARRLACDASATYAWSIQPSSPSTLASPALAGTSLAVSRSQSTTGPLVVTLTVSDPCATTSTSANLVIRRANTPPTVQAQSPLLVCPPAVVQLIAFGQDVDSDSLSYAWSRRTADPGNGPDIALSSANGYNASIDVTAPGRYNFTVTVTDPVGASATAPVTVVVDSPPSVGAGPDRIVVAGDTVVLQAAASDPDLDPLTAAWSRSPSASGTAG